MPINNQGFFDVSKRLVTYVYLDYDNLSGTLGRTQWRSMGPGKSVIEISTFKPGCMTMPLKGMATCMDMKDHILLRLVPSAEIARLQAGGSWRVQQDMLNQVVLG